MRISKEFVPRMGPSFRSKNHQKCQPSLAQTYLDRQHHCYSFFKGRFLSALATIKTAFSSLEKCEKSTKEEKRTRKVHPKMSTLTKKFKAPWHLMYAWRILIVKGDPFVKGLWTALKEDCPQKSTMSIFAVLRAIHSSNGWISKDLTQGKYFYQGQLT